MDPVSHLLLGYTFHALDEERRLGRGALAAFLLGSLAPDIDAALVVAGFDRYLYWHEMGTHSLLGAALCAALTAGLVRLLARGARYAPLLAAALAGGAGHLLFDLAAGGDLRLLFPLVDRRFSLELVAMGDPWLLLPLLVGRILPVRRGRRWAAALLAVLATVLLGKAALKLSLPRVEGAVKMEAEPATLGEWRVHHRVGERLVCSRVRAGQKAPRLLFERRMALAAPLLEASARLGTVRALRRFAHLPLAWSEERDGEIHVWWSDLPFCDAEGCALAFGGAFDRDLAPLRELVRTGDHVRERGRE